MRAMSLRNNSTWVHLARRVRIGVYPGIPTQHYLGNRSHCVASFAAVAIAVGEGLALVRNSGCWRSNFYSLVVGYRIVVCIVVFAIAPQLAQ